MVRVAMKTTTADSLLHRVAAGLTAVLLTGCLAVLAAGCRNGTSTGSDAQPHAVSASSQASPDGTAAETDGEAADSVNADTSAQHRQATERNASDGQSGQEQAVKLELYRRQPQDNEKFVVRDMLPGDSVSQFYAVKVYHDADVELLFTADITEQTKHVINSGGLTYDVFFNSYKHKLSFYSSIQHTDRNSYYGAQQNTDAYGKTNDLTWVAGAMYTGNFERLLFAPAVFTSGIEYQSNSLHDVMLGYNRDMRQDVRIGGGFVQNEWKINRFTLLAGFRVDKHNLIDNPIFSPRVNLMYKPSDKLQARLTWSTGFRAPQAYDEDLHVTAVGGEGVLIKLADGLKPERSNSFSGSIDRTFSFGHWQANLLVEAFYTSLDDVFVLEKTGTDDAGNIIKERRNGNGARVYGFNFDGKLAHGSSLSLQAGFTVQRSRYAEKESWSEDPDVAPTKYMPRTPDCYGYFTLTSAPFRNFDFSLSGVYTGRMRVPHIAPDASEIPAGYEYSYITKDELVHTPDFFELNLKLNYTFVLSDHVKLKLNGGVQNMLNAFQKDLDKGGFRDSGYFYGPVQPRTYFIGFKITN